MPKLKKPSYVTSYTLTSALGYGNVTTLRALREQRGGLTPHELQEGQTTWLGIVPGGDEPITGQFAEYDCRSNRIIAEAIAQDSFMRSVYRARARYGPERIGCFLGTITAGLIHLEGCYRDNNPGAGDLGQDTRLDEAINLFSAVEFCQRLLEISGPAVAISTACSSSAKVFASAQRYLDAGICDAAVVVGLDVACHTIVYGFRSLGLLSTKPCRPWDRYRDGLNIGEAAGFALLERRPQSADDVVFMGFGESSDAYHMTAPHPQGHGAIAAMRSALASAGLEPGDIDYINLHGSGTPANDGSEDVAVYEVFGSNTPCSSTKSWTGHAQGAAGMTEAILSFFSIKHGFIPATLNTTEIDPKLRAGIVLKNEDRSVRRALSNSFGFGGNNCALIFGAVQ
jgi:3-oxoacyl-[acyl-carrier-protein] synthase-1